MQDIHWYWHKCYKHNSDGQKYYMACMGEYQMLIQEEWIANELYWRPYIAKWQDDKTLYYELLTNERHVPFQVYKELEDAMVFLQNYYVTYVHADKMLLGVLDETTG